MSANAKTWVHAPKGFLGPCVLLLSLVGASCGLALEAASASGAMPHPELRPPVVTPATRIALAPREQERLVWRGVDVDGDGQADFANPTGLPVRTCDDYGCGQFGAVRDAGERRHEGVDFDARAGQAILAPISGFVSKIGMAYADNEFLKFVEITNPALHYVTRVFYVDPSVVEGQVVRLGQAVGRSHSLQSRYPGITNHVHLELAREGRPRIDATRLIVAKLELEPVPATILAANTIPAGKTS